MQAPTDNLYKFLAIAGMLCFIYFFFDYNKRADALDARIDALTMQQAEFLATVEALTEWAEEHTKSVKSDFFDNPSEQSAKDAFAKLSKARDEVSAKFRELKVVNAKLNKSIDIVKETFDKLKRLSFLYDIYQFASLFVAFLGVYLWYYRTQQYLDLKEKQVPIIANP
ncbi:hypothetical protein [Pseudomonas juntendi]|uniref:Uncharacterized protein n=1 Tax=Pseudomonas juntendi TaxID=2666183 RepID=A0A7W2JFK1_9PSED|nr:hypothetical protein [Pseudomonas juntendi]MBA6058119.1 hypothetical protein [Pseudomonas juntendi]MBA6126615.1 hypothetical protein [Pseudomonas juntendi]